MGRDSGEAQVIVEFDRSINRMEVAMDNACLRILARRQPAAGDLRLILDDKKAVCDPERFGDEAGRIARQAIVVSEQSRESAARSFISRLTRNVTAMLRRSLDAFARRDVQAALAVARGDEAVDIELSLAMTALSDAMRSSAGRVDVSTTSLWFRRSLERIADHARNIAEQLIYMVEGIDVRHAERDQVLAWLPDRKPG